MTHKRSLSVRDLARVEGEGALRVRIDGDEVKDVRLEIFEPPRYFEAILRGRSYLEPVDITARICGICPVAYQMTAAQALEAALEIEVTQPVRDLRRLLYCGEWIQSHALHIYLLHAPDFLGYAGVVDMARDHPTAVQRGLRLKKAGNRLMEVIGGRPIHPVSLRVGGFHGVPGVSELSSLLESLEQARVDALETLRWAAGFEFPDFKIDADLIALRPSLGYPIDAGRVVSDRGLDLSPAEFGAQLQEWQVPYSNALQSSTAGGTYLVGPLARYSLNYDRLDPAVQSSAREAGLEETCRNPFRSILVRSVEILQACTEAISLVQRYEPPEPPFVESDPTRATGSFCTEAPRGLLYQRYEMDESGNLMDVDIVPPTSQNQRAIEHDLRRVVEDNLDLPDADLTYLCERAVRNHDPCISCATHFLTLDVERG
jgi:sulfhydrogenase subunit alpha